MHSKHTLHLSTDQTYLISKLLVTVLKMALILSNTSLALIPSSISFESESQRVEIENHNEFQEAFIHAELLLNMMNHNKRYDHYMEFSNALLLIRDKMTQNK